MFNNVLVVDDVPQTVRAGSAISAEFLALCRQLSRLEGKCANFIGEGHRFFRDL